MRRGVVEAGDFWRNWLGVIVLVFFVYLSASFSDSDYKFDATIKAGYTISS